MTKHIIDVSEDKLLEFGSNILELLLIDKTTGKNIVWATDDYSCKGAEYDKHKEIKVSLITLDNSRIIQPRVSKDLATQIMRQRGKGEVFTPSWVCNEQNNMIDDAWFGKKGVFNYTKGKNWRTNYSKISFNEKKGKKWQDYVNEKRLEITCGEAPYITSRYDMLTGEYIPIKRRVGLLDRKLRVVNENTIGEREWTKWALRALESIYAFEYQGDNLLIARENILYTFIDNYEMIFCKKLDSRIIKKAANIIAWNIWQMDIIKCSVPYGKTEEECCIVRDWRTKKTIKYKLLMRGKHSIEK